MKSKEALKSICLECEREKGKNKIACPFRSISNEYCEEYDTIEKDLDRLESLEKQNELLKKDLKEYQAYIKKGVEEHYEDFMSDYDLLLQEYQELYKRLEVLEEYRKIEEDLGMNLITLFKALRNGIWTNQEQCYGDEKQGKIRFFQVRLLLEENAVGCIHNSMWKGKEVIRTLYFKDYGKTWALTKEELEND